MCDSRNELRAVSTALSLANHLALCNAKDELEFESKRLNVLLGYLNAECHSARHSELVQAERISRRIYTAADMRHAHAAARECAEHLLRIAS